MGLLRKLYKTFIRRGSGAKRYDQLYEAIDQCHPRHIVEVGTWNGNRGVRMIEQAAKYRPVSEIHYYGFDLFEQMTEEKYKEEISKRPPPQQEVENKLKATGAHIHLYVGDTMKTMADWVKESPDADFVYIDGGHALETVRSDWEFTAKRMHDRTMVIFDDYWPHRAEHGGSKLIVDALDPKKYDVKILPVTDKFNNPDFGELVIQYAQVMKKRS